MLARASVAGASSPPAPERDDDDAESPPSLVVRLASAATGWLASNYFLVGMLSSVALASLCAGLGATGGPLRPEITVNVIAVRLMFLISGFNLPTSELRASVANVRANALIQSFVFGVAGFVVAFAVKPALIAHFAFDPRLANGLVVLACLPTTIGSGVALTNAAGGSVGVALFHAVFSNLAGIALSPALIFAYLGAELGAAPGSAPVSTRAAIAKLGSQVLVPVVIGMAVRASARFGPALASAPAKARLKLASDGVILAIVYNTFCNTFASGFGVPASEITALFFVLSSLLCAYKAAIFLVARYVARLSPEDVVAATFMGSQKTLAFGLPLVKALFDGNPDLAWLCLPTLVYHPMQIALGSALVPKLRAFAAKGGDAEKGGASQGG